jgi:hypothetical protein
VWPLLFLVSPSPLCFAKSIAHRLLSHFKCFAGGAIGPVDDEQPDLRNLRLYFSPLEENALVCLVSDGSSKQHVVVSLACCVIGGLLSYGPGDSCAATSLAPMTACLHS